MTIAEKLRNTNRAEYLLYMWQVEDLIRAYHLDAERIAKEYVARFDLDKEQKSQTEQWYADLCRMMAEEGKREKGHLQICQNILTGLDELHNQLVNSPKFPYYREMYYKVLPYIVELRAKNGTAAGQPQETGELQTCFELLYGLMLLRLQGKPVAQDTEKAARDVATLLGQLSDYYFKNKQEPIEF